MDKANNDLKPITGMPDHQIQEGHTSSENHLAAALPTIERGQALRENQPGTAPQETEEGGGQAHAENHMPAAPSLLNLYVQTFEQAQQLRLETMNRMRCWLRDSIPKEQWPCKDPERSFNDKAIRTTELLPNDLRHFLEHIEQLEKDAKKIMAREVKKHPLWPWLQSIRGIDTTLAARLLHRIGSMSFPSPAHLWSYAGLDGPGWRQNPHNWGLTAVCYNIAESFQKQPTLSGGYRDVYDKRKEYETTKGPCDKCLGQGFEERCRPGHINNKARRYAVKQFLKDFWVKSQQH